MELLTVLAGISSCVTGIGAALILLLRPVREALIKYISCFYLSK